MILSLAIILNVIFAAALIAGLAYAMSRTTLLTPHAAAEERLESRLARSIRPARAHRQSTRVALASARS
ncbi:MAG TPA: hypothetical protein VHT29_09250 [Solirubrobacteraceae bacterium]|jgi:hypothetical protein|nr:hypothetical protein [Solirubrobacteraceae bacterium]